MVLPPTKVTSHNANMAFLIPNKLNTIEEKISEVFLPSVAIDNGVSDKCRVVG